MWWNNLPYYCVWDAPCHATSVLSCCENPLAEANYNSSITKPADYLSESSLYYVQAYFVSLIQAQEQESTF